MENTNHKDTRYVIPHDSPIKSKRLSQLIVLKQPQFMLLIYSEAKFHTRMK
jgi:hypothetical protein